MGYKSKHLSWTDFLSGKVMTWLRKEQGENYFSPGLFALQLSMFWGGCPPPAKDNFQLCFRWPLTFVFLKYVDGLQKKRTRFWHSTYSGQDWANFCSFIIFMTWKYRGEGSVPKYWAFMFLIVGVLALVTVVWCTQLWIHFFRKVCCRLAKRFVFRRDLQIMFDICTLNFNWALPQWVFLTVVPRFCVWCIFSGFRVIPRAPLSAQLIFRHCLSLKYFWFACLSWNRSFLWIKNTRW